MVRSSLLFAAAALLAAPALAWDQPIEPVEIPPSVEQGLEMIYVDAAMTADLAERDAQLARLGFAEWDGAPVDFFLPVHPIYTDLRRALVRYQLDWSSLPQDAIADGPLLKPGATGERVAQLRRRLGLPDGDSYDPALAARVRKFQAVHGLKDDGVAGSSTLAALNRGAEHYERVLMLNLERARRLPRSNEKGRYILVDSGSARLFMYEDGKVVDSMRVVVGSAETETPMMAAMMRHVSVNPYWNVPPDLVTSLIAPRVLEQGMTYLVDRDYEVFEPAEGGAKLDPATLDWKAIRDGRMQVRMRRGPGPWNSMGDMKFMLPNDFGIYLHDVPDADKAIFAKDDRWISNGCVRLEDADRLAKWIFGKVPKGRDPKTEEDVALPRQVPVYMTYLTAEAASDGPRFRPDRYNRDPRLLARFADRERQVAQRD